MEPDSLRRGALLRFLETPHRSAVEPGWSWSIREELEHQGGAEASGWRSSFKVEVELQGLASGWSFSFRVEVELQGGAVDSGWSWSLRLEVELQDEAVASGCSCGCSFRLEVQLQGGAVDSGWSWSLRLEVELQGGAAAVASGWSCRCSPRLHTLGLDSHVISVNLPHGMKERYCVVHAQRTRYLWSQGVETLPLGVVLLTAASRRLVVP
ncbi:unnamed protein product [Boreogadus saida]